MQEVAVVETEKDPTAQATHTKEEDEKKKPGLHEVINWR